MIGCDEATGSSPGIAILPVFGDVAAVRVVFNLDDCALSGELTMGEVGMVGLGGVAVASFNLAGGCVGGGLSSRIGDFNGGFGGGGWMVRVWEGRGGDVESKCGSVRMAERGGDGVDGDI